MDGKRVDGSYLLGGKPCRMPHHQCGLRLTWVRPTKAVGIGARRATVLVGETCRDVPNEVEGTAEEIETTEEEEVDDASFWLPPNEVGLWLPWLLCERYQPRPMDPPMAW